jgi:hypothetical protein
MSLIPDNRECPNCGGHRVAGFPGGDRLSSRCRCDENLIDPDDPPELRPENRDKWRDDA